MKIFIPNNETSLFFLLKKTKKNHYAYLNHKDIDDNNQFWRTVELLLSNKPKSNEITLVEDNKLISEDKDYAELLNSLFLMLLKILKYQDLVILILKQKIFLQGMN